MAAQLPVDDRRLLVIARDDCLMRGWTDGFMVRDAFSRARTRSGFAPSLAELGHTATWTAGLKRLENAGELKRVPLVGARGARRGFGFDLPHRAEIRAGKPARV